MKPAAGERPGGSVLVVPIPRHDDVAARQDLAALADDDVAILGVDDADLDIGTGDADRSQPLRPARMRAVGMHRLRKPGDRHRRLALAVDLLQLRAEEIERALE